VSAPDNSGGSLSAQTTVGAGGSLAFATVCKRHGQQVEVTGFTGTGTAQVHLELSLDDENWFTPEQGGALIVTGNGAFYMRTRDDYPALYARGNLSAIDAGVTGISVSSVIASE